MKSLSFRIEEDVADRVAELAESWRLERDSDVYRRVIEEWIRIQEHPGIRFVDGPAGRRAVLVGGPDVWEIIDVARDFDLETEPILEAYPWLSAEQLRAAKRYFESFPDEIEALIEDNLRVADELGHELDLVVRDRTDQGSPEGPTPGS